MSRREGKMFKYYAYQSKDGHTYCIKENLNPYLMNGDYLLFDTQEECVNYWKKNGVTIDRYA